MQVKLWKIKVSNRSPAGEWKIPAGQGREPCSIPPLI